MKILGLDPASHVTGYAVLKGLEPDELIDCGTIKYDSEWLREQIEELERASHIAMSRHMASKDVAAWVRCHIIAAEVRQLLDECLPDVVAIEVPDGRIGTGARRGARGSLTSYGMAAGWVSGAVSCWVPAIKRRAWKPPLIVPVGVRQWTRGTGDKGRRVAAIGAVYHCEDWDKLDKGGDARDAIGIARFGLTLLGKE